MTSPEVGPLFGAVVANALDAEWRRLGEPADFVVTEVGAGPGSLARSVLFAEPACREALMYRTVERSALQRSHHPDGVEIHTTFPTEPVVGVVFANELLDNLPFTPVQSDGEKWYEIRVIERDGQLIEFPVLAEAPLAGVCNERFDVLSSGRRYLQSEATEWVSSAQASLLAGRLIVIDYARDSSAEVMVRTYAEHGHAGDPLEGLGTKDITIDVDLKQMQKAHGEGFTHRPQAEWLAEHDIESLVEQGRAAWSAGAATGDLAALRGRSRVREAEALRDIEGLGSFQVLEWGKDFAQP